MQFSIKQKVLSVSDIEQFFVVILPGLYFSNSNVHV